MYRGKKEGRRKQQQQQIHVIHLSFAKVYILSYILSFAKDPIGTSARFS